MPSILLPAATALLLLCLFPLATVSAISDAYIRDEDGEPMLNGGTYYILPQTSTNGGGLTAVPPNAASSCPLYITQESDPNSNGLPIKFTSTINSKYLPFGSTILSFTNATANSCTEPLLWRATPASASGHFYVAAGATEQVDPSLFNILVAFEYVQPWNYVINLCNEVLCAWAGIDKKGFLGFKTGLSNVQLRFRKASHGSSESSYVM